MAQCLYKPLCPVRRYFHIFWSFRDRFETLLGVIKCDIALPKRYLYYEEYRSTHMLKFAQYNVFFFCIWALRHWLYPGISARMCLVLLELFTEKSFFCLSSHSFVLRVFLVWQSQKEKQKLVVRPCNEMWTSFLMCSGFCVTRR